MSLIIPTEIKNEINQYSGYINPGSAFSKKTLKGLFRTPENKKYLTNELYALLSCQEYVKDNIAEGSIDTMNRDPNIYNESIDGWGNLSPYLNKSKMLTQIFIKQKPMIIKIMDGLIESHQLPFQEDLGVLNQMQQLHKVNLDFLVNSSKDIIQNPHNLVPVISDINMDTGKFEGDIEYDYAATSYIDGTW